MMIGSFKVFMPSSIAASPLAATQTLLLFTQSSAHFQSSTQTETTFDGDQPADDVDDGGDYGHHPPLSPLLIF